MSGNVTVRPATPADALDVLAWRNDPHTRAMSRDRGQVEAAAHVAWFEAAVVDPERTLLIGEAGGEKVGMVRLDHGKQPEVSINLNPAHRGRGLSASLLRAALDQVEGDVWAEIRDENAASIRLFEGAGFVLHSRHEGLRRYLRSGSLA